MIARTEAEYARDMMQLARKERRKGRLPESAQTQRKPTLDHMRIVDFIRDNPGCTRDEIAAAFGVSHEWIKDRLRLVRRDCPNFHVMRNGKRHEYWIAE